MHARGTLGDTLTDSGPDPLWAFMDIQEVANTMPGTVPVIWVLCHLPSKTKSR